MCGQCFVDVSKISLCAQRRVSKPRTCIVLCRVRRDAAECVKYAQPASAGGLGIRERFYLGCMHAHGNATARDATAQPCPRTSARPSVILYAFAGSHESPISRTQVHVHFGPQVVATACPIEPWYPESDGKTSGVLAARDNILATCMVCSLHQQSHPKVPLTSLSLTRLRVTHNYPSRPSGDTEETERPRREEEKWTKALLGWLNFAEL
jgi:hypothetical protein